MSSLALEGMMSFAAVILKFVCLAVWLLVCSMEPMLRGWVRAPVPLLITACLTRAFT
ncbi:cell number regulator 8 [Phtheirospermum japonicum]|uniref:Cell number regulator 8 n=1 Tax=Phtheirospermum japonicum TaxID=374723 RepID=A0A830B9R2_9LAMI|nr:cell number regulator 8 [Phtheirospermum japonicum]